MKAWIDVDNPPQVQYLCPFARHLAGHMGAEIVLTARDYGTTIDLIRQRDLTPSVLGHQAGASRLSKYRQTLVRAWSLARLVTRDGRPDFLISSSRSSAVTARFLGIPSFIFCDYEFAELTSYRRLGSTVIFPEVIGAAHFRNLGFSPDHLLPFAGIKEDISFWGVDVDARAPLDLPTPPGLPRVLVRPPARNAHYYVNRSGDLYDRVLAHLADRADLATVLSPRQPEQITEARQLKWRNDPVILENKADFIALLKSVDAVISSGGTMLREAAYLGVPAYSIFLGPRGAVDKHLASLDLLTFLESADALDHLRPQTDTEPPSWPAVPDAIESICHEILRRTR